MTIGRVRNVHATHTEPDTLRASDVKSTTSARDTSIGLTSPSQVDDAPPVSHRAAPSALSEEREIAILAECSEESRS
jgi:hypothetical protein